MILERGQPYPLALPEHDGASAHFLAKGGSLLAIRVNGMTAAEEKALRTGIVKAGLLVDGAALLWLFQFFGDRGPALTFDAPFDARLIPLDRRDLPSTETPASRLLVQVHGVDERGILRCLRAVSLSPGLTQRFLSAAMDQLASVESGDGRHRDWLQQDPAVLARQAVMEVCGR